MLTSIKKADNELEEKLVTRAVKGDFAAFEELVNLYKQPLWRFVLRLVGNPEDANDVVQQILIQLYYSLPTLDNPSSFRAWLFRLARNKCLDQFRRKSSNAFTSFADVEGEDGDKVSPLLHYPDPEPLPDEIIERRETQAMLQEAIATLSDRSRQVVLLRYSSDLSFGEIGEALGMNENTAKTLFQRAKTQLRFYLRQKLGMREDETRP